MKCKTLTRSGKVWLYTTVFICSLMVASCAGGDKKQDPVEAGKNKTAFGGGQQGATGLEEGDGSERNGDTIPQQAADTMMATYKASINSLLKGDFNGNNDIMPESETFSKRIIDNVLQQPGVVSLRAYFCMDTTGSRKIKLILVGVDGFGRDVFKTGTEKYETPPPPIIVEDGLRDPR